LAEHLSASILLAKARALQQRGLIQAPTERSEALKGEDDHQAAPKQVNGYAQPSPQE